MKKRDLISIKELTPQEIIGLLDLARKLKKAKGKRTKDLDGKSVGLLFQKPSNRTRVSFEVAVWQLGGNCIYLSPEEIDLGKRESVADVAKTLSRYLDCLVARTFTHADILDLVKYSSIPIINGLSDLFHPCQALADLQSVREHFGKLKGITLAYIGDGNNVCHSLMLGCAQTGMHMRMATPKQYEPLEEVIKAAYAIAKQTGSKISFTNDPREAVKDVQVIYSDVWVSMGQESETKRRLKDFEGFQIDDKLAALADKDYIFMHCLPAHRGLEVSSSIIDGPHSIVFDQAENRLHVQKAILIFLLRGK